MTRLDVYTARAAFRRFMAVPEHGSGAGSPTITLFLCGDVMLGRGIDQIQAHPSDPRLYEPHAGSALHYVDLAERAHGPILRPVAPAYVWGDALEALARERPDVRIVNLETAITTSATPLPKGINYRMHPANISCLEAAAIDACALANNHVLDWGEQGLIDTLDALARAGVRSPGAGRDLAEAEAPAVINVPGKGRVLTFAFASATSGVPRGWAAGAGRPGVNLLPDLSPATVTAVVARMRALRRAGDIVVASIHWGSNWGYRLPRAQITFAHALIDEAGADIVHGHSSHHAKAIEIRRERLILYGCGDFLTDYEGILGYEEFRDDLAVMYLPTLETQSGRLLGLRLQVFRMRKFRLERAQGEDVCWMRDVLDRESALFGTRVVHADGELHVGW
jgi:poly-gamma-glutamate capsule biosynthesis protein CapA/YwtB (metallophosphatase superfamily)